MGNFYTVIRKVYNDNGFGFSEPKNYTREQRGILGEKT